MTQKRDGSYVLLLWRDTQVYDPALRRPLPDPATDVTLQFPQNYDMGVHRLGVRSTKQVPDSASITVPLDGSVTALTLRSPAPAAATPLAKPAHVSSRPAYTSGVRTR